MKEEEINNLAEKHCNEVLCNAHEKCHEIIKCRDWRSRRAGFFCGYEQAVKDMQQENNKLLDVINNQDVKIADLGKQITALEAKNIELSENWRADHDTLVFYDEKLEKDNAELKEQNSHLYNDLTMTEAENAERKDQLTKAKVVLRNVIDYLGQFCSDYPDCVIEAEQFLKEIEK